MNTTGTLSKTLSHLLLICFSLFTVYPFLLMIWGSFKTAQELSANPAGFPAEPTVDNYIRLLTSNGGIMIRTFFNAVYIAAAHGLLILFVSSLAAYAFAKYEFKGKTVIFALLIATIMVPTELAIPPLYILFSKIGWLNSYAVQIIPGIASVFAMFLMRQYMLSIPNELLESARIDGARHFRIYRSIVLPVCSPVIGALAILTFLGKWNDYLWPIVMVNKQEKMPIMVLLPLLNDSDSQWSIPWELVMAGCVLVTVPLIVVFLLFQDKFMASATIGAVKE